MHAAGEAGDLHRPRPALSGVLEEIDAMGKPRLLLVDIWRALDTMVA